MKKEEKSDVFRGGYRVSDSFSKQVAKGLRTLVTVQVSATKAQKHKGSQRYFKRIKSISTAEISI